ncbi:MAG TPA: histidine phosphatase family protein [Rhizobacter sp.]|nr:histidine phosphatase family protein [Rhizobacter sp.]
MKIPRALTMATVALLLLWLHGCASGLHGGTFESAGGPTIANVSLSFVKEDGSASFDTTSNASGQYSIALSPGRYYLLAQHTSHEDYNSAPGFGVVNANTMGVANFFLRPPQVTTVLIVRHGEKQDPNSNATTEPLSAAGQARAQALRETLLRAGITAVYSTDTTRTRDTVAPLAAAFRLPTQIYATPAALAAEVLAQHAGDVVLVAAHSDTADDVANAFGAAVSTASIADFDNLYVVSIAGNSINAMNLQYAADSTPDLTKNDRHAMTLLLVGTSAPGSEAQELLHAARKAGVSAIFTSTAGNPLVAPLAAALGLATTNFNAADMPAFASLLTGSHSQSTVVVAASNDELRALIRQLGAEPFPIIYSSDLDHLVVLTRFPSGAQRVVPLRF